MMSVVTDDIAISESFGFIVFQAEGFSVASIN
ncbi:hypothetical protein RUMTOR_02059 [[Ruminococcus] torques ATCC 27756]|uniref:Uncharacterized protein n=1 Tax=[Ruminococcus] torques ATCC 27756 TaxID=411460 RepID=A5KP76_9FIRM|nr:hypothetical protein RUMTOR_02059 [[Ruminococcus] torques ATCC 27756]